MKTYSIYISKLFIGRTEEVEKIKSALNYLGYKESNEPDLVIVIGGDGSLLHAIRDCDYSGNFLLINAGTLGHYAEYEIDEIDLFIDDIKSGNMSFEKHRAIELIDDKQVWYAVNDIMIGSAIKTLHIEVRINGKMLFITPASGILLSTPFGSSGYAHSLGGSLMTGDSGYELNMLAPLHNAKYHSFISSLILNDEDILDVNIHNTRLFEIACDMNTCKSKSISFKIKKSSKEFNLVHLKPFDEYSRLKKSFAN